MLWMSSVVTMQRVSDGTLIMQRLATEEEDLVHTPNFAFSTLLAEFRERTGHTADKQGLGSGFAPAAEISGSRHDGEAEREMPLEDRLSHAVMLYPVAVVRLMDK